MLLIRKSKRLLERLWLRVLVWYQSARSAEQILVLGDSHAKVFEDTRFFLRFPNYYFHVVVVKGATVSGLENPNSKTQSGKVFKSALDIFKGKTVIVLLGEVDTGFVIWYRAQTHGESVDEMFKLAITSYVNLLQSIVSNYKTIVISAPLPTIRDGETHGSVANARREIKATQRERTLLTLRFNKSIEQYCRENDVVFINFDSEALGDDGLVKPYLLHKNAANHHYARNVFSKMICERLRDEI